MFATLLLLQILTLTDWILGQASSHDYKMILLPCCLAVWMNNQSQAIIICSSSTSQFVSGFLFYLPPFHPLVWCDDVRGVFSYKPIRVSLISELQQNILSDHNLLRYLFRQNFSQLSIQIQNVKGRKGLARIEHKDKLKLSIKVTKRCRKVLIFGLIRLKVWRSQVILSWWGHGVKADYLEHKIKILALHHNCWAVSAFPDHTFCHHLNGLLIDSQFYFFCLAKTFCSPMIITINPIDLERHLWNILKEIFLKIAK